MNEYIGEKGLKYKGMLETFLKANEMRVSNKFIKVSLQFVEYIEKKEMP